MNGYCNGCENHCAANDLHCERGYRNLNEGGERSDRGGHFDTLPMRPGEGMEGRFDTLPIRPGEGVEGRFDTLPMRPGHGGRRGQLARHRRHGDEAFRRADRDRRRLRHGDHKRQAAAGSVRHRRRKTGRHALYRVGGETA